MKIKLQFNGENMPLIDIKEYGNEMYDPEYELELTIDNKNLEILENVLGRVINDEIFNYNLLTN